jgi:predicted nuclease of predicted toxin-antitoxin system
MLLLADENFPGPAVLALQATGHDIAWIRTIDPRAKDPVVLARAVREKRVLLTFDKDFGDLAWNYGLPADCGIVLFRIAIPSRPLIGPVIVTLLAQRQDWAGYFSVIESTRVRRRLLPTPTVD